MAVAGAAVTPCGAPGLDPRICRCHPPGARRKGQSRSPRYKAGVRGTSPRLTRRRRSLKRRAHKTTLRIVAQRAAETGRPHGEAKAGTEIASQDGVASGKVEINGRSVFYDIQIKINNSGADRIRKNGYLSASAGLLKGLFTREKLHNGR